MEHGTGIQQFAIKAQTSVITRDGAKMKDPAGVVKQQVTFGVANEFGDRTNQLSIWYCGSGVDDGHLLNP
jgi:hypothetical protein